MDLKSLFMAVSLVFVLWAMAVPNGIAQTGGPADVPGLIKIQGFLYCTPDGNLGSNATSVQPFVGADMLLACGGQVENSTVTMEGGKIEMLIDPLRYVLSTLLSSCYLVTSTPLSTCDHTLPAAGSLMSGLSFAGDTLIGTLLVANIVPSGFQFLPFPPTSP